MWTEAALARGDRVAATARNPDSLTELAAKYGENLLPLALDVTEKPRVDTAVRDAHERFGRLDVIVNNAGYGLFGTIEEVSEAEARAQIETNLFGALWVTKAALPYLRAQGSGHIIQVSSVGGVVAFGNLGLYHASKWALEGFSQALATEVRPFGIKVTIVEPGGYATDWGGSSAVHATPIPAYEPAREARRRLMSTRPPAGDPEATAAAILKIVDAEDPPLRVLFGNVLEIVRADFAQRLATWEEWKPTSLLAYRPR